MDASLTGAALLLAFALAHGEEAAKRPLARATFAGGCFWCMQPAFDHLEGVVSTVVGYTGGSMENPTYQQVCSGRTGHVEAIEIVFDPAKIDFSQLIETFWRNIDPSQAGGQFADRGPQYETVIFYHDEEQKKTAETARRELEKSGKFGGGITTKIRPAGPFHKAEEYHQKYYLKDPVRYALYKTGSGRESFLEKVWGKKEDRRGGGR